MNSYGNIKIGRLLLKPGLVSSFKKKALSQKGAAVVEFSIIAVLLFLILFGIIEFAILMFDKHVLTNASREGARAGVAMRVPRLPDEFTASERQDCIDKCEAAPHPDENGYCLKICQGVKELVLRYAEENLVTFGPSSTLTIEVFPDETTRGADPDTPVPSLFGTELKVIATYPYDFLLLSSFGIEPINLIAETRMRME